MTPPRSGLDERAVEELLAGRAGSADADLGQALTLVRSLGTGPAPQPTAALLQLLDTGFTPEVVPLRRPARRRTWAARLGAGLTATAASLLVAGTAQALPPALQDGLAELVSAVTPFELPRSPVAEPTPTEDTYPVAPPAPSAPAATPSSASPTPEATDKPDEDRTAAEEREQQRAAEEAAEESEPAAVEAPDDAAREREDAAAREPARADEEVAEEGSEPAERGAEPEPGDTDDDD
jgi:hypothetical protein